MALPTTPLIIQNRLYDFLVGKGLTGVKEIGKDKAFTSAVFQQMMKTVGWVSGLYWCMFYVKAVFYQLYSFDREWLNKNFTGGTINNWNTVVRLNKAGDKRYIAIQENSPQVGDIIILQSTTRKGGGHAGLVLEVIDNVTVKTIEGNTSEQGVRSGQGVFQLKRTLEVGKVRGSFKFIGYIRRNFTEDEQNRLRWDETLKTFVL